MKEIFWNYHLVTCLETLFNLEDEFGIENDHNNSISQNYFKCEEKYRISCCSCDHLFRRIAYKLPINQPKNLKLGLMQGFKL